VRGCRNIYDSFEKYIQAEKLTGENKYNAGKYGLQDAVKGCIFQNLPPVLMLHLKRFEFDPFMGQLCKVCAR
jgi:ubiquitin carboxyl-terminal hydrolase 7